MSPREQLEEPLLASRDDDIGEADETGEDTSPTSDLVGTSNGGGDDHNGENGASDETESTSSSFTIKSELWDMFQLAWPLAVSFFCRMGMASTDSSFVGHITDGLHTAELYLAAAVLSDMCVNVLITPPLAFNQVLNGLVGQAIGSGNPQMAGVWLQQSMFWLAITMLPFSIGCFYVKEALLFLDFPADVAEMAGKYAKYNVFWIVPNGWYQCFRFYFQARGIPRPAMYNNITFLIINGLLNWLFVMGGPFGYVHEDSMFHWSGFGFIGAAISISISRTMQSVVYYCYMFLYKKHHLSAWPEDGWSFKNFTYDRTIEFLKQSVPNMGTLLFQTATNQATTILIGRLGEGAIAASSALSTISYPWSGTLSATCTTICAVRVGYHLGRGNGKAAQMSFKIVFIGLTLVNLIVAAILLTPSWKEAILQISTNDGNVLSAAGKLVGALLVGTYLNLLVNIITSGVFSGMGRPVIATILSFGLELPLSIGGVAIYILMYHGDLLGVYWWQAVFGGIELVIVMAILRMSDWDYWATEAQRRQEAGHEGNSETNDAANSDEEAPAGPPLEQPLLADDHLGETERASNISEA